MSSRSSRRFLFLSAVAYAYPIAVFAGPNVGSSAPSLSKVPDARTPTTTAAPKPPQKSCTAETFGNTRTKIYCGNCRAVSKWAFSSELAHTCDAFCRSFGLVCVDAFDELMDSCAVDGSPRGCAYPFRFDDDAICQCNTEEGLAQLGTAPGGDSSSQSQSTTGETQEPLLLRGTWVYKEYLDANCRIESGLQMTGEIGQTCVPETLVTSKKLTSCAMSGKHAWYTFFPDAVDCGEAAPGTTTSGRRRATAATGGNTNSGLGMRMGIQSAVRNSISSGAPSSEHVGLGYNDETSRASAVALEPIFREMSDPVPPAQLRQLAHTGKEDLGCRKKAFNRFFAITCHAEEHESSSGATTGSTTTPPPLLPSSTCGCCDKCPVTSQHKMLETTSVGTVSTVQSTERKTEFSSSAWSGRRTAARKAMSSWDRFAVLVGGTTSIMFLYILA
eukprot:CAMPEP_0178996680 /NCGR_PEP_ID=MMETSP0795-20121207/8502_1 /TAXON_ID=88552 /ORGANISM="Amoebophrya sp., Strain Ameob2" /LENGTH=443 /DNA_ID=CAMNT_0020689095 /DNA_START=300 /DNA_END=1631 /DNA_ORIENTATION=-